MSLGTNNWQVLDDCLVFDQNLLRDIAETKRVPTTQQRSLAYVGVASQLLRSALSQCLDQRRDYTPALGYRHAKNRLRSDALEPVATSLSESVVQLKRPLKVQNIIALARALLDQALPPTDWLNYEPSDELPERTNVAAQIVRELIDDAFRASTYPGIQTDALRHAMIMSLRDTGCERGEKILVRTFGDEHCFVSMHALVGSAILEVNRTFRGRSQTPTMEHIPSLTKSDIPHLEA